MQSGREGGQGRHDGPRDGGNAAGDVRDRAGDRRDAAGDERDAAGDERDETGDERDAAGDERDIAADLRDRNAAAHGLHHDADARQEAASDRRLASQDRLAGADARVRADLDRGHALADRGSASSDRKASAVQRDVDSFDGLTGVYRRDAGLVELERDIARTRRNGEHLIVAFVDIDGLKQINDTLGHAAGDELLRNVARTLRETLRTYDLVIRYGGDEFVCALSGVCLADPEVAQRFEQVAAVLAAAPDGGASVTVGLAELLPEDSVEDLLARADASLYQQRGARAGSPTPMTGG